MTIVCLTPWFSERMGYSENMLPKALAGTGAEVHVVTSNTQINYNAPNYNNLYEKFLGPSIVDCGIKELDGFTLHRLPFYETRKVHKGPGIQNLYQYLEKLSPDIIQAFEIDLETTLIAAQYCQFNRCKLFTECHIHASIFMNRQNQIKKQLNFFWKSFSKELNLINNTTQKCFSIAPDVSEIATIYFKVPKKKIILQSLGVDTNLFHPIQNINEKNLRVTIRQQFGFLESDVVCIYTGRFSKDKNPHCLAEAINYLQENNYPFKAIFVGNGSEEDIRYIKSMKGCSIQPFVPVKDLPLYYRAADIGVWPREESTSQLDAAACGLPLILSNKIEVRERTEGNGLLYIEGDYKDLAKQLISMQNEDRRRIMSDCGIKKIAEKFSWQVIAEKRIEHFKAALN